MKIKILLLFVILSQATLAVDLNQIIEKNLALRGSKDKLKRISTLTINAEVKAQNYFSSYNLSMKGTDKIKLDITIGESNSATTFNGDSSWITDAVTGQIIKLSDDKHSASKKKILEQFNIYRSVFLDYKDSGYTAELYKIELINDDSVYVIKLTPSNDKKEDMYVYIHARTGLEYEIYTGKDPVGKKKGVQVVLRNNHLTNNLIIPYSVETAKDGSLVSQTLYKTIALDEPVSDSVFYYPRYEFTAEQLAKKYTEAVGGDKRLKKLKNMRIEAEMLGSSADKPEAIDTIGLKYCRSFPGNIRLDMVKKEGPTTFVMDDSSGWHKDPTTGNKSKTLQKPLYNALKATMRSYFVFFDDVLINYKNMGLTPVLVGTIHENGRLYYDLKFKYENGMEYFYFIDAQTFLIYKRLNKTLASENFYSLHYKDYRNTAGLMLPYLFEANFEKAKTEIKIKKIDINTKIAKDFFNPENN